MFSSVRTIPLAGVTPPATLSVVPGLVTETRPTLMANLDWNLTAFYDIQPFYTVPTARVVKTATQAAQNTAIVPLTPLHLIPHLVCSFMALLCNVRLRIAPSRKSLITIYQL
jgi:hypothetical protein